MLTKFSSHKEALKRFYIALVFITVFVPTTITMEEKWSIEKLDGDNWSTWKFQIKHLFAKGLWGLVDGTETLEEDPTEEIRIISFKVTESVLGNSFVD